jgi:hypothetical protein
MREEMSGLRHRWHGFLRRRLERLRGRIDRRIARLDEKEQHLKRAPAKVEREAQPSAEGPAAPVSEPKRPARRRATRGRAAPSA